MFKVAVFALIFTLSPLVFAKATSRTINDNLNANNIVHTALGYSTIIEFSSKPASAILGDQDAFKLEFQGNAVTIKPIVTGAKSNLFINTQSGRHQFTLVTGSASQVDYLVKLRSKQAEINFDSDGYIVPTSQTLMLNLKASFRSIILVVTEVQEVENDLVISFMLSSRGQQYEFSPQAIGVKDEHHYRDIQSIYLSDTTIGVHQPPVTGKLILSQYPLSEFKKLSVVFAIANRNHTYRIQVPLTTRHKYNKGVGLESMERTNKKAN